MSLHRELKLVFTQHLAFITLHDGSYNWLQHWLFQINVTSKRLLYPYFLLLLLLAIWLFPKVQRTICDCSSRLKSTSLAVSPWKKKNTRGKGGTSQFSTKVPRFAVPLCHFSPLGITCVVTTHRFVFL